MRKLEFKLSLHQVRNLFLAEPKKLVFEHIPKCGGTTINDYLRSQYRPHRIFCVNGRKPAERIRLFKSFPEKKRHAYNLVYGHGANQLRPYVHPDALTATVFRDPIERIVSHYYYVCRSKSHYLHHELTGKKMSLLDYVTSNLSDELRNNYVSRFIESSSEAAEARPDESIRKAFQVLRDEYKVVGLVDDLTSFATTLAAKAAFHDKFKTKRLNVTTDRPGVEELEPTVRDAILERNKMDVTLYAMVKEQLVPVSNQ